jgi:hypothetical protein
MTSNVRASQVLPCRHGAAAGRHSSSDARLDREATVQVIEGGRTDAG